MTPGMTDGNVLGFSLSTNVGFEEGTLDGGALEVSVDPTEGSMLK